MLERKIFYAIISGLFFVASSVCAQVFELNPTATLLQENGKVPEEETILQGSGEHTGSAPIEFRFQSEVDESENPDAIYRYQWEFAKDDGFKVVFMSRFEEETTYIFDKSGKYYVRLNLTVEDPTDSNNNGEYVSGTFIILVSESKLHVPNAFSPNGDGINDVFKVTYQSLVKFKAVIFNRWGQKLYTWTLNDIDKGWDGKAHGKDVPNGVYYISVEAVGADGVAYRRRSDINLLR